MITSESKKWIGLWSCVLLGAEVMAAPLTAEQSQWLAKAQSFERRGWTYIHMEGGPRERGFQHGYLLARQIADGIRSTRAVWEYESGMDWAWLCARADEMFTPRIDAENLAELDGIVEGLATAGQKSSRAELVAYNGIMELAWYWWPLELKRIKDAPPTARRESCSAFIATGSMTRDGNVVLGHNSMIEYAEAFPNVVASIAPAKGRRILWQTSPGWIHSGTDFFVTDAGLVGAETTIGGFEGFETNGVPEFVRMRRATQDARTIDEWCNTMRRGNNGAYANAWLLGDINTHEIARLELGLKHVGFERKSDGWFSGSNVAEDLKVLRFETTGNEMDIRTSSVARRVRWKQLMKLHGGRIDLSLAKELEGDHYDVFYERSQPSGRTLCGHYELDREPAGPWPGVPYGCAGTVDGKVLDAAMAGKMSFLARWGSACGRGFDAGQYLKAHPQFEWMQGILKSRPSQSWAEFRAGETSAKVGGR